MAMETKRRDGRASDGRMSHARRPVNALDAAKRAAHAKPVERERLRAAAAGTRRTVSNGAVERSSRAVSFAAALVGIGLALVVVYLIGGALTVMVRLPERRRLRWSVLPRVPQKRATSTVDLFTVYLQQAIDASFSDAPRAPKTNRATFAR